MIAVFDLIFNVVMVTLAYKFGGFWFLIAFIVHAAWAFTFGVISEQENKKRYNS